MTTLTGLTTLATSTTAGSVSTVAAKDRRKQIGRQPQGDDIPLPELVAMFRRAAKKGECPDEQILADFPLLRSTAWVKVAMASEAEPPSTFEVSQREALKALNVLLNALPEVLHLNKQAVTPGSIEYLQRVYPLEEILRRIPSAMVAVGHVERGTRVAPWHFPAIIIAGAAKGAWERAGRSRFGSNATSPLVKFTEEFLRLAGVDPAPTAEAIAMAFQRHHARRRAIHLQKKK